MCYKQAVSVKNDNYFTLKKPNISASHYHFLCDLLLDCSFFSLFLTTVNTR